MNKHYGMRQIDMCNIVVTQGQPYLFMVVNINSNRRNALLIQRA